MLELVMMVCLVSQSEDCKDVILNFDADNATPMQCVLYGQIEMAKWVEQHPAYRIKKWRCGQARQTAKI